MSKKTKKQNTIAKSNPFKVVLPVLCGLVIAVIVAVVISVATAPAKSAKVSNAKETYVTIGSYKVSKQEMYEALKSGSGLNTLQEIIDTDLLAGVTVSEEEAAEIKEELIYGSSDEYEDMTDEEIAEAKEKALRDFNAGLNSMGYLTEEEKEAYIALQVKRYKYAFDAFKASEKEYTDEEYEAEYKDGDSKYEDAVTALIIPFNNEDQLKAYLEIVGVDPLTYTKVWNRLSDVKKNEETNKAIATLKEELAALEEESAKEAKQAEIDAKTAELVDADTMKLSEKEITLAYIQLFNLVNAYRVSFDAFDAEGKLVSGKEILKEGTHYTVGENEVTFNVDAIKALETAKLKLTYTEAEAVKTDRPNGSETVSHGALDAILFDELKLASEITAVEGEEKPELPVVYLESLHSMSNGVSYLAYKLAATKAEEVDATALEEAKATLKEKMIKEDFNDNIETQYLIELRQANELVIYDKFINASYESAYTYLYETSLGFEAGKYPEYTGAGKKSKSLAFSYKVNGQAKEVSADDFFKALSDRYGAQAIIPKINTYALLSNEEYNTVYNPYNGKVYNKEVYQAAKNGFDIYNLYYYGQLTTLKEFKYAFENDVFATYGFTKDYGWKNFERDYMLIQNDDQLVASLLQNQANTLFNLTQIKTEDLQAEMKKIQDEYYSMKVVNMLITVDYNLDNAPDTYELEEGEEQEFWTAEQIELAKELMADLYSYKDEGDEAVTTLEAKLKAIANKYKNATVADATWGKYVQAGLKATVESAADYNSSSSLVEEFHVAMRALYATLEMDKEDTEAGLGNSEAFPTVYGMHQVSVVKTTAAEEYDLSTLTVELYKKHINGEEISEAEEKALDTYLEPAINNLVTTNVNAKYKFALRDAMLDKVSYVDEIVADDFGTYSSSYEAYIDQLIVEENEAK